MHMQKSLDTLDYSHYSLRKGRRESHSSKIAWSVLQSLSLTEKWYAGCWIPSSAVGH